MKVGDEMMLESCPITDGSLYVSRCRSVEAHGWQSWMEIVERGTV